jgi:hypothetical protein
MNITLDFPTPLEKGVVQKFAKTVGLSKEPPLECFGGQIFTQKGRCGSVRVAVTKKRNRIVISTQYINAHMRSYQLLKLALAAVPLGDIPVVEFSQEFAHMDLSPWFPEGKRENNHIYFRGEK